MDGPLTDLPNKGKTAVLPVLPATTPLASSKLLIPKTSAVASAASEPAIVVMAEVMLEWRVFWHPSRK